MTYRIAKAHPDSLFFFPREVLRKMEEAGDRELRILLYTLSFLSDGPKREETLLELLKDKDFGPEECRGALAFWRGCGVLKGIGGKREEPEEDLLPKKEEKPEPKSQKMVDADEIPFYSPLELGKAAEENPPFKALVDYTQKRMNKILNTSELAKLWSFLDYLKMPVEVVMLVIEDCCNREKTSLRYITKVLNSFQDEGIDTYEKAEAYFLSREAGQGYERYVRRLFGLGDRKLTRAEEEMLHSWRVTWNFGEEMLEAAYEKTVASAKNPSIKYMHRILESWHEAGATTPEEAMKKASGGEGKAEKSYDLDDFFDAAVAKGMKQN